MTLLRVSLVLITACFLTTVYGQRSIGLFAPRQADNEESFLNASRPQWSCRYVLLDGDSSKIILEQVGLKQVKSPLFKVHGNVYYDYYYRSNIDTPYVLKNYQQHTIRTYLDVIYKNKYPLRINFTTRISNAGFLKNMFGANIQFNSAQFADSIRGRMLEWVASRQLITKQIQDIQKQIAEKRKELQTLGPLITQPSKQQEQIEEREKNWLANYGSSASNDVTKNLVSKRSSESLFAHVDSSSHANSISNSADSAYKHLDSIMVAKRTAYDSAKKKYDSIYAQVNRLEKQYQILSDKYSSSIDNLSSEIRTARSGQQLSNVIAQSDIPDSLLPGGYKNLLAIKSFGIGRTMINYSELSAQNITINGIQVEYNPRDYYAVAIGAIDYRYRDLILDNRGQQKQYLTIVRYGKGKLDGNNIIVSWYAGKKQVYNYTTSRNDDTQTPDFYITGFTLEGHYKVGNNTLLTGEIAKSSSPYYNRTVEGKSMINSNLSFNDRSNEAYSIKLNTYLPKTGTKLIGMYKKVGANFQSFSLFNSSSQQSIWSARIDQPLFSRKLNIVASIRTNDFSNPYIDNGYYSNTVFKSIQATLRMRKVPVVSIGYFPTSQLTKLSSSQYIENLFYTMTGYLSHTYSLRNTRMNTFLSYARFYNRKADSAFVYFNTRNILLTHVFFYTNLSVSLSGGAALNNDYKLFTTGADMQLSISKNFSLKGGLKYNCQTVFNNRQIGYNLGSTIRVPKLGEIQAFVEKGFIPGINKQLLPNNTGRFTYLKVF